jgi:hypothetical protein
LVVNKETGVTETWNGILFYAKQNADLFNDLLEGNPIKTPIQTELETEPMITASGKFN